MKTRSKSPKTPQIIEIDSDKEQCPEVESFDSHSSGPRANPADDESSVSSCYDSVEQDSQPFFNLAPGAEEKRRRSLAELKVYFTDAKTDMSVSQEEEIKRAPVLNLLRPLPQKVDQQPKNESSDSEEVSIEPPPLSQQSDSQIRQLAQPKKKPKLMQQLQKQLNMPAEEYVITGAGRQVREQLKKQNKKRDYLIDKKFKEYKLGKKKDRVSNQVFNAIEDFFT